MIACTNNNLYFSLIVYHKLEHCRVKESKNPKYKVGEKYLVSVGWQTHSIVTPGEKETYTPGEQETYTPADITVKPLKDYGLSPSLALGVLGMPG